jgi:GTP-binding protein
MASESGRPVVAIVGRPNVGKSTLFNRLIGRQRSIVLDEPGVTRDRIYADAVFSAGPHDREVILVDTGGFDPKSEDPIMKRVLEQTQLAIDEADVVVFLADGRAGLLPEDHDIARVLRKSGRAVIVAVNKLDDHKLEALAYEFERLGLPKVIPLSAAHGTYVRDLEALIVEQLAPAEGAAVDVDATEDRGPEFEGDDERGDDEDEESQVDELPSGPIRVAVIGRPNVGKSSLINRLLGEDRHLVSDVPGTTRDAVDSLIRRGDEEYLLIDTAGIRRKSSIALRVERFSVMAALRGLERSDVALLLLDPKQGLSDQDAKISSFAFQRLRAVVLVVSKWDLMAGKPEREYVEHVRRELAHLAYAPIVFTSARTGAGIERLFPVMRRVHAEYARRIPTGELNRFVEELMDRHPPPTKKGRAGRLYYLRQIGVRPPRFLVSVNDPELIHFSYRRYLLNEIRERYGYQGVPLLVGYRGHKSAKSPPRAAKARKPAGRTGRPKKRR